MSRLPIRSLLHSPLSAVTLLLIFFAQAVFGSVRLSLTTDEPMHIAMGYTSLVLGDYRLLPVHIHPPLVNEWAAWPLLLRPGRPDPRQVPGWVEENLFKFSAQLLLRLGPIASVELATRVPIMLLALLLGALVYRWASDIFDMRAGFWALFLYVFDPGIISGSQFNTTDMGALAFGLLATYLVWRAVRRFKTRRILLSGLALGASMSAKVSGLFFVPMIAALVVVELLYAEWGKWHLLGRQVLRWGIRLLVMYGAALFVVWAVYRFEFRPLPGGSFPVPATSHWLILQAFNRHVAEGHTAFLAGQVSQHGWWWYFPFAFIIKTPLPTLFLLACALISRARRWRSWVNDVWLLAIPAAYLLGAMFSTIDIGYRHLLPVLPCIFIFISGVICHASCMTQYAIRITYSVFCTACLAWLALGTIRFFPHYLAYFNELAGGPDGGWRYLADSNTDWGQALKELAAYQQAHGIERIRLSMFTFIDPAIYGVRYEPLTPMLGNTPAIFPSRFNPPPGDYVISATTLDGIPLADPEMFDWFRKRQPDAKIGHVMFVYRVQSAHPGAWVAECTTPVTPLEPEQIAEGFGRADLRQVYFDCATSWIYPLGGKSPGWVVLARDARIGDARWLEGKLLSYEQKRAGFAPPFRIYESDEAPAFPRGGQVRVAPLAISLSDALVAPTIDLPVACENGLALLGYRLERPALRPGETVYLETVWRIESVPGRLLSIMAHAIGPDGHAVAVGDGLGVPIESWQPGDVFIQRHKLTLPKGTPPDLYWIQTGVYWLDDGQRWSVRDGRVVGDRVLLTALQVR